MPPDLWINTASLVVGCGGGTLITWAMARQVAKREQAERDTKAAEARAHQAELENERLRGEVANLGRVAQSKLYRESFEDVAFAAQQAALRIAVAEEEIRIARQCLELGAARK